MSHRYGFVELENSISEYLKAILNIKNVCLIYDLANMYNLMSLCNVCKEFMDRNASHILNSEAFLSLSQVGLLEFRNVVVSTFKVNPLNAEKADS